MQNKPFISIILPTYNRLYSLKKIFLPSLEMQIFSNYELIVIDDHSSDRTRSFFLDEIKKYFPQVSDHVRYFRNKKNIGAPASRNRGSENAKGEWIYVTEDDVQIDEPLFLKKTYEILKNTKKNVAVVSPKRMESNISGYYKNPKNSFVRVGKISGEIYLDPTQEYSGYVENTHASSFIRRNVFLEHKEDEVVFFGNTFRDETDLYYRIVKSGKKIWYCGDVLKTLHRNDFAKRGGQKKIASKSLLERDFMEIKNHYQYLKKNSFSFPFFRGLVYFFVRWTKHFSNISRLYFLKNFLSKIAL
ncbi:glycosyltransferase family 2 protein [bacterium]|nr:glycosyltransferase family 2 protein [bacterium]